VGNIKIKSGGTVRIKLPFDTWTKPVWLDSIWRKYYKLINVKVDVESEQEVETKLSYDFEGAFAHVMDIELTRGTLQQGDKITFTYGYKKYGGDGITTQTFPEEKLQFVDENFNHKVFDVAVATDKYSEFHIVEDCPRISIIAGPPEKANVVAPSIIQKDDPFDIKISMLDKCRNRPHSSYTGELLLKFDGDQKTQKCDFDAKDKNRKTEQGCVQTAGIHRIKVVDNEDSVLHQSNPMLVEDNTTSNIYWGDIHGHSKLSDGANEPEEYYKYGRDMANLDICALTDHETAFKEQEWAQTQRLAEKYYQPHEFVTFKAFEWTSNIYGHYNVYYRKNETDPILTQIDKFNDVGFSLKTSFLLDLLKEKDVLIAPHHTLVATQWDSYDPKMRMVEVYSCWGRSEYPGNPGWDKRHNPWGGVQNALEKGYKLGFSGGSDTHDGLPGRCYPGNRASNLNHKGGLIAVYANELTRETIFDAIFNRHCYGTTGERIILNFTVNDYMMGEEIEWRPDETPEIKISTVGTTKIETVEIVRNNQVIASFQGDEDHQEIEYLDEEITSKRNQENIYYYARVTQQDGEMAWSSPIWLTSSNK
jgi:hypothetical protein